MYFQGQGKDTIEQQDWGGGVGGGGVNYSLLFIGTISFII